MLPSWVRLTLFMCLMLTAWSTGASALEDAGFPKDSRDFGGREDNVAVEQYIELANENDARAQFLLGRMYANGRYVEKDVVQAYIWLDLAERNGVQEAAELKNRVDSQMSAAQIAAANRRIEVWQQRHGPPPADAPEIATADVIREVQRALAAEGYYRGTVDGVLGQRTRDALRQYQQANGLSENGRITPTLLADMGLSRYLPPSRPIADNSEKDLAGNSALKQELRRLIRRAEREDAAEPWLLRRLAELAGAGNWPSKVLREHFEAPNYRGGRDWRTLRGSFTIDPGNGLVASSGSTWGAPQDRADDLALNLLEILQQGGQAPSAEKLARMEKDVSFANAFALRVRTGPLDSTEGLVFSVERDETSGPDYRFVFHPGKGERAKLFATYGDNAREVPARTRPFRLEKRATHTFTWTRSTTGEMTVSVDGMELLRTDSPGKPEPFDRLGVSHIGARIVFKDIELSEQADDYWR